MKKAKITLKDISIKKPPNMTAGDVRNLRKRLGMTQKRFAVAMNLSINTIQALEQERYPAGGVVLRLLQIFNENPALARKIISLVV